MLCVCCRRFRCCRMCRRGLRFVTLFVIGCFCYILLLARGVGKSDAVENEWSQSTAQTWVRRLSKRTNTTSSVFSFQKLTTSWKMAMQRNLRVDLCSEASQDAPRVSDLEWVPLRVADSKSSISAGSLFSAYEDTRLEHVPWKGSKRRDLAGGNYVRVFGLLRWNLKVSKDLETERKDQEESKKAAKAKRRKPPSKDIEDIKWLRVYCTLVWELNNQKSAISLEGFARNLLSSNSPSDKWTPFLISCPYPPSLSAPSFVAVSTRPETCVQISLFDFLRVMPPLATRERSRSTTDLSERYRFGVCVKGLNVSVSSNQSSVVFRLVEWIEGLRLLGAAQIDFYILEASPEIQRVLLWYSETKNFVRSFPLSQILPEEDTAHLQSVALHDCFYRNKEKYHFIIPLEVDELIVPLHFKSWQEVFYALEERDYVPFQYVGSHQLRRVYNFFDELPVDEKFPEYAHILRHSWRQRAHLPTKKDTRAFLSTDNVLTFTTDSAVAGLFGEVKTVSELDPETVAMCRYRSSECNGAFRSVFAAFCSSGSLKDPVREDTVQRFAEALLKQLHQVFQALNVSY